MRCAVHGKMRAVDCLIETGAGWVCSPGNQCKNGNKEVSCKFWQEGKCTKGEMCPFAHGEPSMGPQEGPFGYGKGKGCGGWGPGPCGHDKGCGKPWRDWMGGKDWGPPPGYHDWGPPGGKDCWGPRGCGKDWGPPGGKDWGCGKDWGPKGGCCDWGPPGCGGDWGPGGCGHDWGPPCWGGKGGCKGPAIGAGPPLPGMKGTSGKGKGGKPLDEEERYQCADHGKLRAMTFLQDMGGGVWVCKEGFRCQVADAGGVKRAFCRFYANGSCQRGEACTFAHAEEEIGAPIATEVLDGPDSRGPPARGGGKAQDGEAICLLHNKKRALSCLQDAGDGSGGHVCKPGSECKDASSRGAGTPCKFWAQGKCVKPDCPFLHDGEAIGARRPPTGDDFSSPRMGSSRPPKFAGGFDDGFSWGPDSQAGGQDWQVLCSVHNKMRRASYLEDAGDGRMVCRPGSECQGAEGSVKRSMCKFWMQGSCQRGSQCAFAHDESELGAPVPEGALLEFEPKGAGKGKSENEDKVMCARHGKMRVMSCLEDSADGTGAFVCRSGCECRGFSADGAAQPVDVPCRYWAMGKCSKGEACPFVHPDFGAFQKGGFVEFGKGSSRPGRYSPY